MVTYKEAVAYLEEIPFFTKKNTPEKTAEFYKYVTKHLPLPQQTKVIHVAGTNGKGSVCAYLQPYTPFALNFCAVPLTSL